MLQNKYLKDWSRIVSYHFPHLSLPEVAGLSSWSFGMVITGSSSLTRVSELIAKVNGEKTNTVRKRLKEWYQESKAKKGKKRKELDVSTCFVPLLKWIISLWNSEEKWLPLAIDTTNIGSNFTVLSLHVLYQGCGIPVAWKIVKGTEKGSWKPHWQNLFESLSNAIPDDWQVIVSADRGLYADWLFAEICALNWHPFLRINYHRTYGWHWHKTRLREPARAERIWLAMAVATLWTVTVGSDEQRHLSEKFKDQVIIENCENQQFQLKPKNRTISCFLQGLINIIADLLCGKGISLNGLFPQSSFVVNTS